MSAKLFTFAEVNELKRHIEVLLLRHDCVVVPGFGGFVAHHADAYYDAECHTYFPPSRTVGFNPHLTINDSLLAQSYAETYDISYPDATKRIESTVEEVRKYLSEQGAWDMNGIGVLSASADGTYLFVPQESGVATPEYYGLSICCVKPLVQQQTEESVLHSDEKSAEEPQVVQNTEEGSNADENAGRYTNIMLRNLAAACIAVIAFLLWPTPIDNYDSSCQSGVDVQWLTAVSPKSAQMGSVEEVAEAMKNAQQEDAAQAEPVQQQEQTAPEEPAADEQEKSGFCIVLASKTSHANANSYVEALTKRGIDGCRSISNGKYSRVVCGNFATRQEADQAAANMRRQAEFAEVWVMKTD